MRGIVVALALAGCASVPDPAEAPPDGPPVLSLRVDVSSGSGEMFVLADGTMATAATFMRGYEHVADRPSFAKLSLTLLGMPVVIELDMCDSTTSAITAENVTFKDVSELDGFGVVGKLMWSCDFANGRNATGNKDSGIVGNPDNLPVL